MTLVPVRVFDCGNSTAYSTIIEALDWVIADHAAGEPAVANLSLGGPADLAMNEAIAAVIADGIVVVVAAGNDGQDACGTSPASAANALTVGATDVTDTRASFSNLGPCLDLFAPGVDTLSDDIASDHGDRGPQRHLDGDAPRHRHRGDPLRAVPRGEPVDGRCGADRRRHPGCRDGRRLKPQPAGPRGAVDPWAAACAMSSCLPCTCRNRRSPPRPSRPRGRR
mgnify:CR=1 FL=1